MSVTPKTLVEKLVKDSKGRNRLAAVTGVLALFTVLITVGALTFPAISLSGSEEALQEQGINISTQDAEEAVAPPADEDPMVAVDAVADAADAESENVATPIVEATYTAEAGQDASAVAVSEEIIAPEGEQTETEANIDTKTDEVAYPAFNQSVVVDGVEIIVSAPEGAFPEGSVLQVISLAGSAEEEAVTEAIEDENNVDGEPAPVVAATYAFDITILDANGNEIQPANGKKVNVSFIAAEATDEDIEAQVYHVAEDGTPEALHTELEGDSATATTTSFSTYVVQFTTPSGYKTNYNQLTFSEFSSAHKDKLEAQFSTTSWAGNYIIGARTVNTWDALAETIADTVSGYPVEITLGNNLAAYYPITIPAGKEITIKGNGKCIVRDSIPDSLSSMFIVDGGKVTFDNVAFDGREVATRIYVSNSAAANVISDSRYLSYYSSVQVLSNDAATEEAYKADGTKATNSVRKEFPWENPYLERNTFVEVKNNGDVTVNGGYMQYATDTNSDDTVAPIMLGNGENNKLTVNSLETANNSHDLVYALQGDVVIDGVSQSSGGNTGSNTGNESTAEDIVLTVNVRTLDGKTAPLANKVGFKVYWNNGQEDPVTANSPVYTDTNGIASITLDTASNFLSSHGDGDYLYIIKPAVNNTGMTSSPEQISYTITVSGNKVSWKTDNSLFTFNSGGSTPVTPTDPNAKGVIIASKYDENGNHLAGAELQLLTERGEVVDEWTSDGTPHVIGGLTPGATYILHEESAPAGYKKNGGDQTITLPPATVVENKQGDTPTSSTSTGAVSQQIHEEIKLSESNVTVYCLAPKVALISSATTSSMFLSQITASTSGLSNASAIASGKDAIIAALYGTQSADPFGWRAELAAEAQKLGISFTNSLYQELTQDVLSAITGDYHPSQGYRFAAKTLGWIAAKSSSYCQLFEILYGKVIEASGWHLSASLDTYIYWNQDGQPVVDTDVIGSVAKGSLTNTPGAETEYEVIKTWQDASGAPTSAPEGVSVTFTLYRTTNEAAANAKNTTGLTPVGTITLPKDGSVWNHTFTELDALDGSNRPYYYFAVESAISGYKLVNQDIQKTTSNTAGTQPVVTETGFSYQTTLVDGGEYVFANDSQFIMDNSGTPIFRTTRLANATTDDNYIWVARAAGNGFVLQNKASGRYLYWTSTKVQQTSYYRPAMALGNFNNASDAAAYALTLSEGKLEFPFAKTSNSILTYRIANYNFLNNAAIVNAPDVALAASELESGNYPGATSLAVFGKVSSENQSSGGSNSDNNTGVAYVSKYVETFTNAPSTTKVLVTKYAADTGQPLAGATLQVFDAVTGLAVTESWVSETSAHELKLGEGSYILREISTPSGYWYADSVAFSITASQLQAGETINVSMFDPKVEEGKIIIRKVDDQGKLVSGAVLALKDASGNVIARWNTADENPKEFTSAELEIGKTYTVVEESVPDGYETAQNFTFEVTGKLAGNAKDNRIPESSSGYVVTENDNGFEYRINNQSVYCLAYGVPVGNGYQRTMAAPGSAQLNSVPKLSSAAIANMSKILHALWIGADNDAAGLFAECQKHHDSLPRGTEYEFEKADFREVTAYVIWSYTNGWTYETFARELGISDKSETKAFAYLTMVDMIEKGISAPPAGCYPYIYYANGKQPVIEPNFPPAYVIDSESYDIEDKRKKADVDVTKEWQNADGSKTSAPVGSVTGELLCNGEHVESFTLDSSNNWTASFTDLAAISVADDGTVTQLTYTVRETSTNALYEFRRVDPSGPTAQANGKAKYVFTLVNEVKPFDVALIKYNSDNTTFEGKIKAGTIASIEALATENKDEAMPLDDVIFTLKIGDKYVTANGELKNKPEDALLTTGKGNGGLIEIKNLKPGTYTLQEIQSPNGYVTVNAGSNKTWTIVVSEAGEVTVPTYSGTEPAQSKDGLVIGIGNAPEVYTLPSTGGIGTQVFAVIGGLLMLVAGALFVRRTGRQNA